MNDDQLQPAVLSKPIYALAQRPGGVACCEVREALGIASDSASRVLRWMTETCRLRMEEVREGRTTRRYYADPAESFAQMEKRIHDRVARARAEYLPAVAKGRAAKKAAVDFIERVEFIVVDGRKVKKTVCRAGQDTRFTVSEPTRYFSAMTPGSYVPGESWAARVCGARA